MKLSIELDRENDGRWIAKAPELPVGGGDSFASGLICGFLTGQSPQLSVECGAAHGAPAMTTPGDTSMATVQEVLQAMEGVGARIAR